MEIRELNVALPKLQVNAPQGKQELPAQDSFQRTLTQKSLAHKSLTPKSLSHSATASKAPSARMEIRENEVTAGEEPDPMSELDIQSKRKSDSGEEGIEFAWMAMAAEPIRIEADDAIGVEDPSEMALVDATASDSEVTTLIPTTAQRDGERMPVESEAGSWNHLELPKVAAATISIGQQDRQVLKAVDQVLEEIEMNEWIGMPMDETEIQQELKRLLTTSSTETRDPVDSATGEHPILTAQTPTEPTPQQTLREIANRLLTDVKLDVSAEDGAKLVMVPQERMHFEQMVHPSSPMVQPVVRQIQPMIPIAIHRIPESQGVQIRLTPEHLGKVDLKLQLVQDAVRAEIRVENQVVKAAVEAGLADLKQSLSERGYEVREIQVQVSKDPHDGGGQAFYQSKEGKREERNKKSDYLEILSRLETDEVAAAEL
ncbi:MAG: flagellar hook-length control protein FliK [Bacillota bacterium]|nr:flagellar hook-length control protein FliK [Bacillota bacterium]